MGDLPCRAAIGGTPRQSLGLDVGLNSEATEVVGRQAYLFRQRAVKEHSVVRISTYHKSAKSKLLHTIHTLGSATWSVLR